MSEHLFWLSLYILFGAYFVYDTRMQTRLIGKHIKILMDKDMEILRLIQENGELQKQLFTLYEERNAAPDGTVGPG